MSGEMILSDGVAIFKDTRPTVDEVRARLRQDKSPKGLGDLYWRDTGKVATYVGPGGYRRVKWDDTTYMAAHLAWLMRHGQWPIGMVKRRNGNPKDDRVSNLRPRGCRSWPAFVMVDGVQANLGEFETEAEALTAKRNYVASIDLV